MMLKTILLFVFLICVYGNPDDFYERCLDGFTYRFRSNDVTLPTLSKILAIAYPNALYVSRQTDSVYVSLKNEETYEDIRAALGDLHIKIEYVNLLVTYTEFQEVQADLEKYNIRYEYGKMEQFFNPTQCEVYIPPSDGSDGKILTSLEAIQNYTKVGSDYLLNIQKLSTESLGFLETIESIVKTAVGIAQTIRNIYQGSYQIYQFLTGASANGAGGGEICPFENTHMEIKPPLPVPNSVFSSTLNDDKPQIIPTPFNNFQYLVEYFANMTTAQHYDLLEVIQDPFVWTTGPYELNLFIGQGKNIFGINWDDNAKAQWNNFMKSTDPDPYLYVHLQNEQNGGRQNDPMELVPGSKINVVVFSATSIYYPYKFTWSFPVTCPDEPAKCLVYYQFIIKRSGVLKLLDFYGVTCEKTK